jgi:hypothetical protein
VVLCSKPRFELAKTDDDNGLSGRLLVFGWEQTTFKRKAGGKI